MKITYIIVLFCVLVLTAACAFGGENALSEQEIYSQFTEANLLFDQGNAADGDDADKLYGEAILHFEKIVDEGGIKNAGLYYNLANAYLLKGDVGRAIVNYRRSEKLDGSNTDIKKNLAFARSRRIDQVQIKTEKKVLQTLFFWHYDFSMKIRFFLACLFFAILCLGLTAILWFGRKTPLPAVCAISAILVLGFATSVSVEKVLSSKVNCGVIVDDSVLARQGDGHNYPPSFKDPLHSGTEFDLIKTQSGWYNIQLSDGSEGWVPQSSAELI